MARKTYFNSLDRQTYNLARSLERESLFPTFSTPVSPTVLRSRGLTNEEIAFVLECPVDDVDAVIAYDKETARVSAGSDKDLVKEMANVDSYLSSKEITVTVIGGKKPSTRGKK